MTRAAKRPPQLLAGVDIGGTKIHAVICRPDGRILARARKKTKAQRGFEPVMARVADCLTEVCDEAGVHVRELAAVGVGAPSAIRKDGVAVAGPNVGWRNAPLTRALSKLVGRKVVAENDCNLGTLAEARFGAGRGATTLVGLFMGTGLGGGIVIDGEMVRGESRLAAEVGHMIVSAHGRLCGCGHRGCLEAYASKSGIGRQLKQAVEKEGQRSRLTKEEGLDLANVPSSVLARLYAAKDRVVVRALDEAAFYLGVGVANLVTLLGPQKVVLGGGVMEAMGRRLLPKVRAAATAHIFPSAQVKEVELVLSVLGDDAVALGAAAYAAQLSRRS